MRDVKVCVGRVNLRVGRFWALTQPRLAKYVLRGFRLFEKTDGGMGRKVWMREPMRTVRVYSSRRFL